MDTSKLKAWYEYCLQHNYTNMDDPKDYVNAEEAAFDFGLEIKDIKALFESAENAYKQIYIKEEQRKKEEQWKKEKARREEQKRQKEEEIDRLAQEKLERISAKYRAEEAEKREKEKREQLPSRIIGTIGILLAIVFIVGWISVFVWGCARPYSGNYQLHNKDGSLNWEYVTDMWDYYEKHPEKNPAGK